MRTIIFIFLCLMSFWGIAQNVKLQSDGYGISVLSYKNTVLLDRVGKVGAPFYSEGAKVIRKGGKIESVWPQMTSVQKNAGSNGYVYTYDILNVNYQYKLVKDSLFVTLLLTNTSKTDTLTGFNIIPFHLQFPKRPTGFQQFVPYYHYNLDGPSIITADFGNGELVVTNEDVNNNVFVGLLDANTPEGKLYKVWVSAIPFNGMVTNGIPNLERKIAPGKSLTYHIALRFYPGNTPDEKVAPSVVAQFRAKNKMEFAWKDKRPIGTLFLSSVDKKNAAINPRGFIPTNANINITTADGLRQLRNEVLDYAKRSIAILKSMNAQGAITWDIEGQQFPHDISYVGSPDKLQSVAPEMNSIADEYFSMFTKAGFKVGICIRPQEFTLSKDKTSAVQKIAADPAAVLIRKIKYARSRWGCTLFYIDSNVDDRGILMNADVFKQVHNAVPDVLLMPEHQNIKYFEFTAPYEEMRMGTTGLDAMVKTAFPAAFMAINTADGLTNKSNDVLKQALLQGNIFLFRAWFDDQPANGIIKKLYSEVHN
jgi:hypothetical protein